VINVGQEFTAIVDFAHSPDSVERVLKGVRESTSGKLIGVLGCGGDRDKSKRALMGQALVAGTDYAIFTSDNPRSEDPLDILRDMTAGMTLSPTAQIEVDRRSAIAHAVALASAGDCVILLGKGHESGQEVNGVKLPFDDRIELAQAIGGSK
jgi:UDP-N-acetylmuramoyl-L-alanyl-D-glutamate--2,6-diaminopimelate ligase